MSLMQRKNRGLIRVTNNRCHDIIPINRLLTMTKNDLITRGAKFISNVLFSITDKINLSVVDHHIKISDPIRIDEYRSSYMIF